MLLLKATERNWGLMGPGDWDRRSWKIYDDGWFQYKEQYRSGADEELPEIPDVVEEGSMTEVQLQQLMDLLESDWSQERTDACDGVAWEFKMYRDEEIVKHRELGYIYGVEPYERIVEILGKVVEKP